MTLNYTSETQKNLILDSKLNFKEQTFQKRGKINREIVIIWKQRSFFHVFRS